MIRSLTTLSVCALLLLAGCDGAAPSAAEAVKQEVDTLKQEAAQTVQALGKAGGDKLSEHLKEEAAREVEMLKAAAAETATTLKETAVGEARNAAYGAIGLTPPDAPKE